LSAKDSSQARETPQISIGRLDGEGTKAREKAQERSNGKRWRWVVVLGIQHGCRRPELRDEAQTWGEVLLGLFRMAARLSTNVIFLE